LREVPRPRRDGGGNFNYTHRRFPDLGTNYIREPVMVCRGSTSFSGTELRRVFFSVSALQISPSASVKFKMAHSFYLHQQGLRPTFFDTFPISSFPAPATGGPYLHKWAGSNNAKAKASGMLFTSQEPPRRHAADPRTTDSCSIETVEFVTPRYLSIRHQSQDAIVEK